MLFRQDRITGLEKALAVDFKHIAAIVSDLLDEIGLACEDRKLLVAVNRMNRLNANTLDRKGIERLGYNEPIGRYMNTGQFL